MNIEDLEIVMKNRVVSSVKDTQAAKDAEREAIRLDVERFLAEGGQVQQVGQTAMHQPEPKRSKTRQRWTD